MKKNKPVAVLILLCLLSPPAVAQYIIPDSTVTSRIQEIQQMLDQGKPGANRWWYGWLAGYGAATVVQGAVYFSSDDLRTQQDMAVGAATTFLGVAGQLVTPMVPGYAPGRLRKIPGNTPEERLEKLNAAEEFLMKSYQREKMGRSWQTHALTILINAGTGMVVWLGFDRTFLEGFENFALNTVITETQIFTQPVRAIRDFKKYNGKYHADRNSGSGNTPVLWYVSAYPGGLQLRIQF